MTHTFYSRFIKPISTETDQAEREIVLNYLLVGILALSILSFTVTLLGPAISHTPFHPARLFGNFVTTLFIIGIYVIARYGKLYRLVAVALTMLIALFGCFVASEWGVLNGNSVLLLSLAVVMAGILVGARYSLYITCGLSLVMIYLQHGEADGSLHPDLSWLGSKPAPGDIVGFLAILFLIALVSWLFNRQMELSLKRARRSEKALQRQKQLLEIKVEKRAQQLEAAQLEKMQELYRFAELGRLSTALFHDLANHLSTVSLDIEGLTAKDQSQIMQRIGHNVGYIDTIVKRVREQIRGKNTVEVFAVMDETNEVLKILAPAARQANVAITVKKDASIKPALSYKGDVIRFRQIILNLICNAIESYPPEEKTKSSRSVTLGLERRQNTLFMTITDHGVGISAKGQAEIFKPFYTTKDKGAGIGLFIVKQVVENDFNGAITLASDQRQGTTVSVSLPKSYYAKVSGH
jgi:signal transduction histidine kinase